MNISSFHLVKIPLRKAVKGLFLNLIEKNTKGLIYSEYMTAMTLGSPILSPSRFLIREIAIFAQWESEKDYFVILPRNDDTTRHCERSTTE